MPNNTDMAFVVVQHLSPNYRSMMQELLSKHTRMRVAVASNGLQLQKNEIYLIPPKHNLTVFNDKLMLIDQDHSHGVNLPIDVFFRSLAEDRKEEAIAIVLSGTGSDGTRGIRAVKEQGGIVMVQEEPSAKFDGMPRSAIATGLADFILPPDRMAEQLVAYGQKPFAVRRAASQLLADTDELTRLLALVRGRCGVDFSGYKESTILRRIERRMGVAQIDELKDYVRYVEQSEDEAQALFSELLIGLTKFMRDAESFAALCDKVLPEVANAHSGKDGPLRVWVPACSTGEEAYTIAMLLRDYLDEHGHKHLVKIFATDIDRRALEFAGAGVYPVSIAADLPADMLGRYFVREGDGYRVSRRLREMVIFAAQDVTRDPPFTRLSLISCRNFLIYIKPDLQKRVLSLLHFALGSSGFLLLGNSETVGELNSSFAVVDATHKIYRSRGGGRYAVAANLAPLRVPAKPFVPGRSEGPSVERPLVARASETLVQQFGDPCVLTTEQGELVHTFGPPTDLLRVPPGRASLSVYDMVPNELAVAMSAAAHRARTSKQSVTYRSVRVAEYPGTTYDLTVSPVTRTGGEQPGLLFVVRQQQATTLEGKRQSDTFDASEALQDQLRDLQGELQYTRESLQATIEELETSNEELQATNEELLASNEELQSTNEELHSVNEELYTVNAEYQARIGELTTLHAQFDALLSHTLVGWLFVDRQMHILKTTPEVRKYVNVIDGDIGRSLTDISHNLDYPAFFSDVQRVVAGEALVERRVRRTAVSLSDVLVRIVPYKVEQSAIEGAVVSLLDLGAWPEPTSR